MCLEVNIIGQFQKLTSPVGELNNYICLKVGISEEKTQSFGCWEETLKLFYLIEINMSYGVSLDIGQGSMKFVIPNWVKDDGEEKYSISYYLVGGG